MGRSCIKEQMPASNKLEGKTQEMVSPVCIYWLNLNRWLLKFWRYRTSTIHALKNTGFRLWLWCTTAVTVVGLKCEMLSGKRMRSELQYPAVVMVVGVKYEISDSVTVALRAPGEDLGSLCWGIRLSQSKPFHIIGQGHLLSGRSGEAFPTNATQLARSSILCFTALLLALNQLHLSFFFILASSLHLSFLSSSALHLFLSVIGYALVRCVIGLYTLRWRNRPGHTIHLCWILMNVSMRCSTDRGRQMKLE